MNHIYYMLFRRETALLVRSSDFWASLETRLDFAYMYTVLPHVYCIPVGFGKTNINLSKEV